MNLGRFDLHFAKTEKGWGLSEYEYALLPITEKIKEAKDVKAVADQYAEPLKREIVARLPENLIGKTPDGRTRLTAQATVDGLQRGTGADLSITVPGDGAFDVFRSTTVTRYDLQAAWPFKNRVVIASLTGAELIALKEKHPTLVTSSNVKSLEESRKYSVAIIDFIASGTLAIPPITPTDGRKIKETGQDMRDVFIAGWAAK